MHDETFVCVCVFEVFSQRSLMLDFCILGYRFCHTLFAKGTIFFFFLGFLLVHEMKQIVIEALINKG